MDPLDDITIKRASPSDTDVCPLILAHLAFTSATGPACSNHAMDTHALGQSDIQFWTISDAIGVLGCGALKFLPGQKAEVKSVHISKAARGRGLARRLMMHLIDQALGQGARELVLETGSMDAFKPARSLYSALGFSYCDPILGYSADPNSVFMRLALDPSERSPQ